MVLNYLEMDDYLIFHLYMIYFPKEGRSFDSHVFLLFTIDFLFLTTYDINLYVFNAYVF